ncbi:hypothetical protein MGG_17700 [Pyricularia oryzae 70-15]|uniref:Uncharacterized protein n=2 Tax=Pyricularia oryzae TaxID=318829 RepID=G4NGR1_PYRO7|nr:uncharacterized protein MGG_17700 [Pyricularia oryzae 70-15]EHA47421.1 hypothetical protein MGG_17700 [Pyricularia oryzae 70-15]
MPIQRPTAELGPGRFILGLPESTTSSVITWDLMNAVTDRRSVLPEHGFEAVQV